MSLDLFAYYFEKYKNSEDVKLKEINEKIIIEILWAFFGFKITTSSDYKRIDDFMSSVNHNTNNAISNVGKEILRDMCSSYIWAKGDTIRTEIVKSDQYKEVLYLIQKEILRDYWGQADSIDILESDFVTIKREFERFIQETSSPLPLSISDQSG